LRARNIDHFSTNALKNLAESQSHSKSAGVSAQGRLLPDLTKDEAAVLFGAHLGELKTKVSAGRCRLVASWGAVGY
jgi:hypothetical protein